MQEERETKKIEKEISKSLAKVAEQRMGSLKSQKQHPHDATMMIDRKSRMHQSILNSIENNVGVNQSMQHPKSAKFNLMMLNE